jgi:hypothetical protein
VFADALQQLVVIVLTLGAADNLPTPSADGQGHRTRALLRSFGRHGAGAEGDR